MAGHRHPLSGLGSSQHDSSQKCFPVPHHLTFLGMLSCAGDEGTTSTCAPVVVSLLLLGCCWVSVCTDAECIVSVIVLMVARLDKDSHLTELARKLAVDIGKQVSDRVRV